MIVRSKEGGMILGEASTERNIDSGRGGIGEGKFQPVTPSPNVDGAP